MSSEEEDFQFEYESDEESEPDVEIENQYYSAKGGFVWEGKRGGCVPALVPVPVTVPVTVPVPVAGTGPVQGWGFTHFGTVPRARSPESVRARH